MKRQFAITLALVALSGCADPLANVERLDQVQLADGAAAAALPTDTDGLLSQVLSGETPDALTQLDGAEAEAEVDVIPAAAPERPRGLLGLFRPRDPAPAAAVTPEQSPEITDAAASEPASDAPIEPVAVAEAPARQGFFGGLFAPRDGNSPGGASVTPAVMGPRAEAVSPEFTPGAPLPYGTVARACGLPQRELGTRIGTASGYSLFDTNPGSTALRTHYLTGFSDNCPRQFTAALATFGDVGTHEILRYLPSNASQPYTATDEAYEGIKARFCGAGRGQPCGARIDRLARRTTFVSVYQRFETSPVWANILLHNGDVVAMDFDGS